MATKAELLDQAREKGLDVKTNSTKKDLESMLNSSDSGNTDIENVTVNENEGGEATNGTTREGDEDPIKNGEAIPQNGVTKVDVVSGDDNDETEADENRTQEEVKFADDGNPNNKARLTGAGGGEYDQDGNPRTGGKSYGVADDRNEDVTEDVFESNRGEPNRENYVNEAEYFNPQAGSEGDTNNQEWDVEDQEKLAESLSEPENGIKAIVTTSTGNYVRVKFLRNSLAFGTYKSRNFQEADAKKYLSELKESRGL